jgi:hypothetical protein
MHQAIKACGETKAQLHSFLTATLDGSEYSASRPGRFVDAAVLIGLVGWWVGGWGIAVLNVV